VLLGAAVTGGLLVVMSGVIATGGIPDHQEDSRKIAAIWQTDRSIEDQLKNLMPEKPEEPLEPPPEVSQEMDVAVESPVIPVNRVEPGLGTLNIGLGGGFNRDSDYIPIYVPRPDYPPMALRRGISGYAVIEVTITETGGVRDPKLVEEYPQNKGFGKYALRAAKKLKYKARKVDGVAQEVPGVLYKFSFQIAK
jgi:protein TonB